MRETNNHQPLLSVITVVRNDPDGFRATCESLALALDQDMDWIVVDGSDSKSEIPHVIADLGLTSVEVIRDKAAGIYPAMNQGLNNAFGAYVYFLNAGDTINSLLDLEGILHLLNEKSPPWLIARVKFESADGRPSVTPSFDYDQARKAQFARGLFPPHQGTIVRTQLLKQMGGFDTHYQITADYQAMLKLSRLHAPITTDHTLACFKTGGASSTQWLQAVHEFHRARREVLKPAGLASLSEHLWTLRQVLRQGAFHLAVSPIRRRLIGDQPDR